MLLEGLEGFHTGGDAIFAGAMEHVINIFFDIIA